MFNMKYILTVGLLLSANFGVWAQTNKGEIYADSAKDMASKKLKQSNNNLKQAAKQDALVNLNQAKSKAKLPSFDSSTDWKNLSPFKFKLPEKKFGAGGSLSLTGFYTDIQNPRSLNERQYLRINANPKITILGLPFTSEIYYTTENNKFYNSNNISLHFDKNKFVKDIQDQAKKQALEYKQEVFNLGKELKSQQISTQNLKQQLENQKRSLQFDSINSDKYLNSLETQIKAETENQIKVQTEKIKSTGNAQKDSMLQDSILLANQQKIDSLKQQYEIKKQYYVSKKQEADSLYKVAKEKYELVTKKTEEAKAKYDQAKAYVSKVDSISKDPQSLLMSMVKDKAGGKLLKSVALLQKMDIGNTNPYYGDYMLNALPTRGADIETNIGKWIVKASGGLTMSNLITSNATTSVKYDRNIGAFGIGYKSNLGTIQTSAAYIWDKPTRTNGVVKNALIGINTEHNLFKKINITNDIVYSDYQETLKSGIEIIRNYSGSNNTLKTSAIDKMAIRSLASYNAGKLGELSIQIKQLGAMFQNAGTPFMRRDYREIKAGIKEHFFKNKISLSAYYLENSDNLRKEKAFTNSTKGFGFQGQSNFTKGPNFAVSYTPFTQGAYHPDSLLRTNNQYSTKMASVNYQKNSGQIKWFTMVSYSDGMLQFGDTGIKMHNRNVQGMISIFTKKVTSTITYSKSFTEGRVDTLNFDMVSTSFQWNINKKISIGIQNQSAFFENGGYRIYSATNIKINLSKHFQFNLQTGYTFIEKIWGINKSEGFTGKTQLLIRI